MKKISKHLLSFAIICALFLPFAAIKADADPFGINDVSSGISDTLGSGEGTNPTAIATRIINLVLSFLGLIALVIILTGGFKYMTSQGNSTKTDEAKKIIISGVIGLAIVLASWGVARWIIDTLNNQIINEG
jgi:hypothetical protein